MRSLLFASFFFLVFSLPAVAAEVHLSVAASMNDAVKELVAAYEKEVPGATFLPNFASSGSLAKQIAQGAPADLYISANPRWMNYLVAEGRVSQDQVRTLAQNALVFVGQKGLSVTGMEDVAKLGRIAIGSPKSVPAGQYAEQALREAGLLGTVQGKLVMAQDVRQALIYADRGEADGAFVYRTDALLAREVVILFTVPPKLYDEVSYPVALTLEGRGKPEAVGFYEFLKTEPAGNILKKYGFVVN